MALIDGPAWRARRHDDGAHLTLELPAGTTSQQAFEDIGRAGEAGRRRRARAVLSAARRAGVMDDVQIAVPGDIARAEQVLALREAVSPRSIHASAWRKRALIGASKRPRPI